MTHLKRIVVLLIALLALVLPISAQAEGSIIDVARANENLRTLVAALEASDPVVLEALGSPAQFTVFAPTDEAFQNLLSTLEITAQDLLDDSELLTQVILYHVVSGAVNAERMVSLDGQFVPTLLNGEEVLVGVNDGAVTLNEVVNVVETDIEATNGVIHVIDNVLLPAVALDAFGLDATVTADDETTTTETDTTTTEETTDTGVEPTDSVTPDVPDEDPVDLEVLGQGGGFAGNVNNTIGEIVFEETPLFPRRFSILQRAIQAADPAVELTLTNPDGSYTLLAPPDFAFQNLVGSLGITIDDLLADTDLITDVLLYHVYDGYADEAAIRSLDGTIQPMLLEGEYILIGVNRFDQVAINTVVEVIGTDIQASNGVIHVINDIILPYSILDSLGLPRP